MSDEHSSAAASAPAPVDFIRDIIADDIADGKHHGRVATRFPPEPNGYLHIGHAKSICLNFGVAEENGGTCNLRFDDTNPTTEDVEYVDGIKDDVRWLGFNWSADRYASDYFERLYQFAVDLIKKGLAYVDSLDADQIRAYRGTLTEPLCTLEFEDHRPLYDWLVNNLIDDDRPQQIEFARLNLNYTVMSKRKLLQLVQQGVVSGWDDPRMPTLGALRRRGYTPASIRNFCARIGVAKKENVIDVAQLEHSVREDLNRFAPRVMAVLRPLRVVLTNYPEGQVEEVDVINNPEDESAGTRKVPFSRELLIEREDFLEHPPKKFYRLSPGREVRLRCAYFIACHEVVKNDGGEIVELRCTYDPATRGGDAPDGRRVKATLHWVSAPHAIPAEVRLYDRLFSVEDPERVTEGGTFLDNLNPASLEVIRGAQLEPALASATPGLRVQFERLGYFCADRDSRPGALVFNRTVSLKDTWARISQRGARSS